MTTFFPDDNVSPRLNLNNTVTNKRTGKLPIDVGFRIAMIFQAVGIQAVENLRMKRTPKEQMTRNFIISEVNRVLQEYDMPIMNKEETLLFIFYMTKFMDMQQRKKKARLYEFMKDATKGFEK